MLKESRTVGDISENRKFWIYGIIGCICFGIGDWLLGYVDPTSTGADIFYFIRAGHGAEYAAGKAAVTMALAMVGMLFYLPALLHISDVAGDQKTASHLNYTFGLCAVGWFAIHFLVTVNVAVYSWMAKHAGEELANGVSNHLGNSMLPCLYVAYLFVAVPCVWIIIDILRNKTVLKKSAAFFTPLVWMAIAGAVANMLPASPFSYGLYTFCMNAGMLVWFIYLLIKTRAAKTNRMDFRHG